MAPPDATVARVPADAGGAVGWKEQLLAALKAPATQQNLNCLHLWAVSEGMPDRAHNWLATSLPLAPYHHEPPFTMPFYGSVAQGVKATADTLLRTPNAGYGAIVTALRTEASPMAIWRAINASSWCKGCQGGAYPGALRGAIDAGSVGTAGTPPQLVAGFPAPPPSEAGHDYHRKVQRVGAEHKHTGAHLAGGTGALRGLLAWRRPR